MGALSYSVRTTGSSGVFWLIVTGGRLWCDVFPWWLPGQDVVVACADLLPPPVADPVLVSPELLLDQGEDVVGPDAPERVLRQVGPHEVTRADEQVLADEGQQFLVDGVQEVCDGGPPVAVGEPPPQQVLHHALMREERYEVEPAPHR